ncbi:hypothetical protein PMIN01_03358 [Paraphaeosphaeria minitans]|uniref:A-kinase anchor protein 7-like phosphoesterase domain-containing protein n=1 Tax=Paraphaeosphaeria minitans TaxID=565426 RepID=A0A9P6GN83_9PLEO|nr:hypothetical protein PMIN01_03358 [Paraphaeosphaeria minitans]
MGKRSKLEYNDFLDGEKLRDNTEIWSTLQRRQPLERDAAPAPTQRHTAAGGKKSRGGPKKPQLTHFLCLPLVNPHTRPQLEAQLSKLRQELGATGFLPVQAVRPPGTLHLTLGVMALDDEQLRLATRHLAALDVQKVLQDVTAQSMAESAAASGTVSENLNAAAMPGWEALGVDLKGLVPMQAPHETSILYAEPADASGRLQAFGEKLRREFTREGWLVEDKRTLRLHATVVNTIYAKGRGRGGAKGPSSRGGKSADADADAVGGKEDHDDGASTAGSAIEDHDEVTTATPDPSTTETKVPKLDGSTGHGPQAKSWLRFDARDLIERYSDVVWAEKVSIDRVQICKMGAKKTLNEAGEVVAEEYEVVAEKVIGAC